jgi:hypothetical protein
MPHVRSAPAEPSRETIEAEIAQLRDLDAVMLRKRWQTVFRKAAPPQLPRHLLFRIRAYRLQAEVFGDLDAESRRLLDGSGSPDQAAQRAVQARRSASRLRPGTVLGREWNGRIHRVTVVAEGFAWNGKTYSSLSTIASAITGTRWNGPRFFGLRDRASPEARP